MWLVATLLNGTDYRKMFPLWQKVVSDTLIIEFGTKKKKKIAATTECIIQFWGGLGPGALYSSYQTNLFCLHGGFWAWAAQHLPPLPEIWLRKQRIGQRWSLQHWDLMEANFSSSPLSEEQYHFQEVPFRVCRKPRTKLLGQSFLFIFSDR